MSRDSHDKRQREKKRQERAAEKRQRREARPAEDAEPVEVADDELMERFRILSEQRAAGVIDLNTYEAERKAIFEELGVADPIYG